MNIAKVNDVEIPIQDFYIINDINSYYSYVQLELSVGVPVGSEVTIDNGNVQRFVVIKTIYQQNVWTVDLLTKEQYNFISSTFGPIQGNYDLVSLCSSLGIGYMNIKTKSTFWMLPEMGFVSLIKTLRKYVSVVNGGAPHVFLTLDARLAVLDLKLQSQGKAIGLTGDVASDVSNSDWMLSVPGTVNFCSGSIDGLTEDEVVLNNQSTKSLVLFCDHTGFMTSLRKTQFDNDYNRMLYKTREITLTNTVTHCSIGDYVYVSNNGQEKENIITGVVGFVKEPMSDSSEYKTKILKVYCK